MQRLERDVTGLSREDLVDIVIQQEAIITALTKRIQELEARLGGKGGPTGMPGIKPTGRKRAPRKESRKPREKGYSRRRSVPTERVEHQLDTCPECQTPLRGGSVHHTREVIEIPVVPANIVEHVYIGRECPNCQQRKVPKVELEGEVAGEARLGVNLMSLITTLREEGRLPVRTIQWFLETIHQLHLSVGAIVAAVQRVAWGGKEGVEAIKKQIQGGAVVNVDETGWRQDGTNGYIWSFSNPENRYFIWGNRGKGMVDRVLAEGSEAVLVSDFYAGYNHYDGLKQRCWVHLLRDAHELVAVPVPVTRHWAQVWPDDERLKKWATGLQGLYTEAKAFSSPKEEARYQAQIHFEEKLLGLCRPYLDDEQAVQGKLCRRIWRHLKEMFVFVANPAVPADNNGAERSLRHLVTIRKISGGSRSPLGTETKMVLASLFGTWRAQGLNPLLQCRLLLSSP